MSSIKGTISVLRIHGFSFIRRLRVGSKCHLLCVALVLLFFACCTKEAAVLPSQSNVAHVAASMEQFRMLNRKPPESMDELKSFMNQAGKFVLDNAGVSNAEAIFVSERDKQPIVVLMGRQSLQQNIGDDQVYCYEKQGVNGNRYVGFIGGIVEEVDETRLRQLVRNP